MSDEYLRDAAYDVRIAVPFKGLQCPDVWVLVAMLRVGPETGGRRLKGRRSRMALRLFKLGSEVCCTARNYHGSVDGPIEEDPRFVYVPQRPQERR